SQGRALDQGQAARDHRAVHAHQPARRRRGRRRRFPDPSHRFRRRRRRMEPGRSRRQRSADPFPSHADQGVQMNRLIAALLVAPGIALAAPETYTIDAGHTHPGFAISHFGFSTFRGRFDKTSGTITIDRDKKTLSADVTIDVTSISTGVAKLDEHLKSPDFFDAAKYPTITF